MQRANKDTVEITRSIERNGHLVMSMRAIVCGKG